LPRQYPSDQPAIIGQHRQVAPLIERVRGDLDLIARHAPAGNRAAHHPIDAAVPMVCALVAIFAKGAAKFGYDRHGRLTPGFRPDRLDKTGQGAAQFADAIGQIAGDTALIDMRVPTSDIDEGKVILIASIARSAGRKVQSPWR
jgi:hypothetical protein